jgi:hypothetical protein
LAIFLYFSLLFAYGYWEQLQTAKTKVRSYKLRTTGELLQQKTKAKVVFSWVFSGFSLSISTKILPTCTKAGKKKVYFYANFAKIHSISAVFRLWQKPKASVR